MKDDAKLVFNALDINPKSTAGQLWNVLKSACENRRDREFLKANFKDEDQSVRVILAKLEKQNLVKHEIMFGSILKVWDVING